MPESSASHPTSHPSLVLTVYAEELVTGARAAIFGDATLRPRRRAARAGRAPRARLRHRPRSRRRSNRRGAPSRSIFYAPLHESGDVGVRDGAFDFVLVPDLSIHRAPRGSARALAGASSPRRALLLIASPNPEAPDAARPGRHRRHPARLLRAVRSGRRALRVGQMIGQAPFVGYAVAEFAAKDPEPTIDTSLAERRQSNRIGSSCSPGIATSRASTHSRSSSFRSGRRRADDRCSAGAPDVGLAFRGELPAGGWREGTVLADILEAEREAAFESLRQQEQAVKEERFRAEHAVPRARYRTRRLSLLRERCEHAEASARRRRGVARSSVVLENRRLSRSQRASKKARPSSEQLARRASPRARSIGEGRRRRERRRHRAPRGPALEVGRELQELEGRGRPARISWFGARRHQPAAPQPRANRRALQVERERGRSRPVGPARPARQRGRPARGRASKWKIAQLERELSQQR